MAGQTHKLTSSIIVNNPQLYGLVTLRVLIGWHILYEGVSKLINPYWSSAAYLLDSKWIFSGLAKTIVSNPTLLTISDYVNMWGLTLVGLCLILGAFNRQATFGGMVFILLLSLIHIRRCRRLLPLSYLSPQHC